MSKEPRLGLGFRQASITLREATWLALDTLRAHKLRSFLTLLGVILAVTTLVSVMSVLNGLNLYVSTKIANLGSNAFVLDRIGIITNRQDFLRALKRPPLRMEDYEALKGHLKYALNVAAEEDTTQDIHYGSNLVEEVTVIGATPEFAVVRDFDIASGRFMMDSDESHRTPVCFIGNDIVEHLFGGLDPI